ncbi:YciI family protein [Sulfitobacter sp. D35]|uniref:YciI family protein n=1 Tax=Sulfitobacter sp. D35 TaxID=3083252 RepID=UPI00296EDC65|nr:YciI family protein [Sulfitobacter sp. D35]MDW4498506.1 YciI family protein [Sulfitobacter sp. D35]
MKYIVLFEDAKTADPDIRAKYMSEHLAFLARHADAVSAAGPLDDPEGKGRDGLWIVDAQTPEEVERLVREDPFWPTGLRGGHAILPWKQVFPKSGGTAQS